MATSDDYTQQTVDYCNDISAWYETLYSDHMKHSGPLLASAYDLLRERQIEPRCILDIGCGTGRDIIDFHHPGDQYSYFGFDLSPAMIAQARRNLVDKRIVADLWIGDVLQAGMGATSPEQVKPFDLAIFRGNTFGHIPYEGYPAVFANVHAALRPGGAFLFDFRDGVEQFMAQQPTEVLGHEVDTQGRPCHFSFYIQEHGRSIEQPYRFTAVLITWQKGFETPEIRTHAIKAHYVQPTLVLEACVAAGFTRPEEISNQVGRSLPFLRSFLAYKS